MVSDLAEDTSRTPKAVQETRVIYMTEYRFRWWPARKQADLTPSIAFEAPSPQHGVALALQRFVELGCDVNAVGAHIDVIDGDGARHTVLIEEVLDWLKDSQQVDFVERHGLAPLIRQWQL